VIFGGPAWPLEMRRKNGGKSLNLLSSAVITLTKQWD